MEILLKWGMCAFCGLGGFVSFLFWVFRIDKLYKAAKKKSKKFLYIMLLIPIMLITFIPMLLGVIFWTGAAVNVVGGWVCVAIIAVLLFTTGLYINKKNIE
jgi:hypothetical protein